MRFLWGINEGGIEDGGSGVMVRVAANGSESRYGVDVSGLHGRVLERPVLF